MGGDVPGCLHPECTGREPPRRSRCRATVDRGGPPTGRRAAHRGRAGRKADRTRARHYQVRSIDVATGRMDDAVVVDKANTGEEMAGRPVIQLRRADGMVLTLDRGAEHPFIHALSSRERWAICIDLPPAARTMRGRRSTGVSPKRRVAAAGPRRRAGRSSPSARRISRTRVARPRRRGRPDDRRHDRPTAGWPSCFWAPGGSSRSTPRTARTTARSRAAATTGSSPSPARRGPAQRPYFVYAPPGSSSSRISRSSSAVGGGVSASCGPTRTSQPIVSRTCSRLAPGWSESSRISPRSSKW